MVEDVTTDGRRIAELLASELTGLRVGPLEHVAVVDAHRDVEPTADGALVYRIEYADQRIGEVRIRPGAAVVVGADAWSRGPLEDATGLFLEDDDRVLVIERGAAVKRAVDALRESLGG